jgi:hypothetical protein
MRQAIEYISNLAGAKLDQIPESDGSDAAEKVADFRLMNVSAAPLPEVLEQIVHDLASASETPIAVVTVESETGQALQAHCGVPADLASGLEEIGDDIRKLLQRRRENIVAEDIGSDPRFTHGFLLGEKGIRFCMIEPLVNGSGRIVGFLLILDTRSRSACERDHELLGAAAAAVIDALELRSVAPSVEENTPNDVSGSDSTPTLSSAD